MNSLIIVDLPGMLTPLEAFRRFSRLEGCFFLDNALQTNGGFSVLGALPAETWVGSIPEAYEQFTGRMQQISAQFRAVAGSVPYGPGAVGALSYDLGRLWEGVSTRHPDGGWPLFCFGIYEAVYVYDHHRGAGQVLALNVRAADRLAAVLTDPAEGAQPEEILSCDRADHEQSRAVYEQMTARALEAIAAGEVYEINMTRRVVRQARQRINRAALARLYLRLRQAAPASWGGYFDAGSFQLLSVSPEQFLELRYGRVTTRPMKGTRPRGVSAEEDRKHRQELELSAKEKAELLMVTDLERNDLGRVCRTGSVRVCELRRIEEYAAVFQAVSTIEGELAPGSDWRHLLKAVFPGGSVTGCPKRRSLELIDTLETSRRNFYTGAFGHIGLDGSLTMNMLIRTLFVRGRELSYGVGSGIVADSDPAAEFDESVLKAEAIDGALDNG